MKINFVRLYIDSQHSLFIDHSSRTGFNNDSVHLTQSQPFGVKIELGTVEAIC